MKALLYPMWVAVGAFWLLFALGETTGALVAAMTALSIQIVIFVQLWRTR